jgi:hypothetical protein
MKRTAGVLSALLLGLVASYLGYRWFSDRATDEHDRVYREYDQQFREHLADVTQLVGKETIKVERLSDRFTVPQKLTIQGTPFEVGLTIGHFGKRTKAKLPLVAESNRDLNQKLADLYRKIYPQQLEVVRGVADAYGQPVEQIDLVLFEQDFCSNLWCDLLQHERFYKETDFSKQGDLVEKYGEKYGCSMASYFANGHQLVGRNFDLPSDRPHYFLDLQMEGTYQVLGHTVYDITGEVVDGINEKGFSLSVASNIGLRRDKGAWAADEGKYATREAYPREPAIVFWHMTQVMMQTCASVDEALELLRAVKVWFPAKWRGLDLPGSHWLLADATGKSVIVEWTAGDHELLIYDQPGPGELITNLTFQEGENLVAEKCPRYAKAKPLLDRGVNNMADMLEVMKSMRISGPGRSLWISVMDLNERTFEVRYFKEFERKYEFSFPGAEEGLPP